MKSYSLEFRQNLVEKLLYPGGPTVIQLSRESGISKSSLYKWLRYFGKSRNKGNREMLENDNSSNSAAPIRPQNWSAAAKLEAINKTSNSD